MVPFLGIGASTLPSRGARLTAFSLKIYTVASQPGYFNDLFSRVGPLLRALSSLVHQGSFFGAVLGSLRLGTGALLLSLSGSLRS